VRRDGFLAFPNLAHRNAATLKFTHFGPLNSDALLHGSVSNRCAMKKQSMFSVGNLRTHADELVAAVAECNDVMVIAADGEPKAVLQGIHSFHSLRRAVDMLETLATESADCLDARRAEIHEMLAELRGEKPAHRPQS